MEMATAAEFDQGRQRHWWNCIPTCLGKIPCIRSRFDSLQLDNDPRNVSESVLSRHLGLLDPIIVAATLISTLSWAAAADIKPLDASDKWSWLNVMALVAMTIVTLLDLFCVAVLTQQMYYLGRLVSGGPFGLDIAMSLFGDKNFASLRHIAIASFFVSVPTFMLGTTPMVYQQICPLGEKRYLAIPTAFCMVAMTLVLLLIMKLQHKVFEEVALKMKIMKQEEKQIRDIGHQSQKSWLDSLSFV
uniref:Uncharacterized protein n=1 Tax=Noctiluca scintillans TaxID=2966 RepID=A0A7S1F8F5_NOCSC|mmetsp:Transcript_41317/g.109428  ORF Transcript_41317/g.109428 Transcript_41317/m.109428 type:complete len:245 (+) Transcript_41317:114-848(+)|eukprot:CAMPEP_0194534880 /NCGR_PEP_ID=MMETSP0253-20130528/73236_1 /TAXON_ID=2966 /ORGANISM="Noctiluca scintillans" /LENGTH=244 /DNA_ID=CAMNT_0039380587 /DNA_START=109 /DNA_END=843 /DNA_ORIENTATION=-